jgi:hypothetical protein
MGMTISGYDSSSISTLFSSLSSGSSSSSASSLFSGSTSWLSDYYSIRNGSYHRLLKAYYAMDTSSSTSSTKTTDDKTTSTTTATTDSTASAKELSALKSDAGQVSDSVSKLMEKGTKSLFNKVSSEDAEGKVSYDYDTEAIYNAVSTFADDYNKLYQAASESKVTSVKNAATSMSGITSANSKLLSSVGIIMGTDGKLSVDADTFKAADMTVAKSLFNATGGYAYQIGTEASVISSAVVSQASGGTYTSSGAVSVSTLVNSFSTYA